VQQCPSLRSLIGFSVLTLVLCTAVARNAIALPGGLLARWSGDIDAHDNSGQGHNGTLEGGAQAGMPGLIGGAFQFNGTGAFVSTLLTLPTQGTIVLWVNPTAPDSIDGIFGTIGRSNGDNRLWLTVRGPDGGIGVAPFNLVLNTGSCCANEIIASTRPNTLTDLLPTETWTHLAVTFNYDPIAPAFVLYINGAVVGVSTETRPPPTQTFDFGGVRSVFGQNFYWYGLMDEVLVFDHVLSPEEIETLALILPFTGFFPPISNLPAVNVVQAGQALSVKFSLGGNRGVDIFASGYPQSKAAPCDAEDIVNDVQLTDTAGGSGLKYDPATDTYTYVWKTEKTWRKSCRTLLLQLTDGVIHTADFRFEQVCGAEAKHTLHACEAMC
jgi:hypothetical protein